MYNVSSTFKTKILEPSPMIIGKVEIGTYTIYDEDIVSFSIESYFSNDGIPSIGGVVSSKLILSLLKTANIPAILTTQTVKPYVALEVSAGTFEYVPLGVFNVNADDVKKTEQTITIECLDKFSFYEDMVYTSALTYPSTVAAVRSEMAATFGITFATQDASLFAPVVSVKPEGTVRQVISDIAELLTRNAIINRNGLIEFKTLTASGFALSAYNYSDFELTADNTVSITNLIIAENGDIPAINVGTSTGYSLSFTNSNITNSTQLEAVFNRLYPLTYQPYTLSLQGMPHLDVGDTFTLTDANDIVRTLIIASHKLTYNGGLLSEFSASAPSSSTVSSGSTGTTAITQSLNKIKANVMEIDTLLAGNITADNISANSITATQLAVGAITAGKAIIADAAIKTAQIQDAAITTLKVADAAITNAKIDRASVSKLVVTDADIANASINGAKITSATIGTAQIATGAITNALLGTAAVDTAQIKDGSITDAKIVGLTANKITAGTIDAGIITVTNLNAANITVGTINGVQISAGTITSTNLSTAVNTSITNAQTTADIAKAYTDALAVDSIIMPNEKIFLKPKWDLIIQEAMPSLTNILVNSDFNNGTTSWTPVNSTLMASNNTLSATGTGTNLNVRVNQVSTVIGIANESYFIKVRFRTRKSGATILRIFFISTSTIRGYFTIDAPIVDTWYEVSGILNIPSNAISGAITIGISNNFPTAAEAIGAVMEVQYPVCINLNSTFGTNVQLAETINSAISTLPNKWFDGTKIIGTITQQANLFGVSSTNYVNSFINLSTYLSTKIVDTTTSTTGIVRNDWNTVWNNYYAERTNILNSISEKSKIIGETAQTTADGKNTVYYNATIPSGGTYKINDTWFDSDDGNKIYKWNGTAWEATQFGTSAISNLSITNALIADATIQNTKIANLDAAKITTGYLSAARIQAGTLDASVIIANTITASQIAVGTVTATQIAANTITGDKLVVDTITAREIAASTITANEIAGNTITAAKMVAGTITAASGIIADATITTAKIADANITTAKIANLAVTNALIADATIASAKIAALDAAKITTGYLAAARIQAGSLNASVLTAGTITAALIAATGITADKIIGGTLTLGGINNASGIMTLKDNTGAVMGTFDNTGVKILGGIFQTSKNINGGGFESVVIQRSFIDCTYAASIGLFTNHSYLNSNTLLIESYKTATPSLHTSIEVYAVQDDFIGIDTIGPVNWNTNGAVKMDGKYFALSSNITAISVISGTPDWGLIVCENGSSYGFSIWASDEKLKENIVDNEEDSLSKIMKINHKSFDWKKGGHTNIGYVSQQLKEIDEDFIMEIPQGDGSVILQPKESTLIPTITKAIQQQQEIIEAQGKEITELKNIVKSLLEK